MIILVLALQLWNSPDFGARIMWQCGVYVSEIQKRSDGCYSDATDCTITIALTPKSGSLRHPPVDAAARAAKALRCADCLSDCLLSKTPPGDCSCQEWPAFQNPQWSGAGLGR